MKTFSHSIGMNDDFWKFMQESTGKQNPATDIRNLLNRYMFNTIKKKNEKPLISTEGLHKRWAALNCADDPYDPEFMRCKRNLIDIGGEISALEFLEKEVSNGLRYPKRLVCKRFR